MILFAENLTFQHDTEFIQWEDEKKEYKETVAEKQKSSAQERKREEDEYKYSIQRSRSLAENNYADKVAALEKALLTRGADGDQRVLETKISALVSLVSDQTKQIEKLNNQQERVYQQVQDIAAKAITGAAERLQAITVKTVERVCYRPFP